RAIQLDRSRTITPPPPFARRDNHRTYSPVRVFCNSLNNRWSGASKRSHVLPPLRIATGAVHCGLETTRKRQQLPHGRHLYRQGSEGRKSRRIASGAADQV